MGSELRPCQLGDVVELVRGVGYKPAQLLDGPEGAVPLLRATNIGARTLDLDDVLYVPHALVRDVQVLKRHDVVIAMSSGSKKAVGRLAQLRSEWPGCVGAFCGVIRAKPTEVLPEYLGYVLQSLEFRTRVETYAVGTAIMNLSRERLLGFPLALPSTRRQRAVADILGALDDKIELNRKLSRTLDETAHAVFRRHVVDVGELPDGWTEQPLDSLGEFRNGLAMQKYPPLEGLPTLPVIKIAQLRAGNTHGADIGSANLDPAYLVHDGDLLFSWSGSLEAVWWTGGDGALNQHLFKVTSETHPLWFVYFWIHQHLPSFRHIAAGKATTMGHINRGHLTQATVLVPPAAVIADVGLSVQPLVERSILARLECRTLASLRDALLPGLLSGELRIADAEKVVEEVI